MTKLRTRCCQLYVLVTQLHAGSAECDADPNLGRAHDSDLLMSFADWRRVSSTHVGVECWHGRVAMVNSCKTEPSLTVNRTSQVPGIFAVCTACASCSQCNYAFVRCQ
jgi:hypothetical protein